MLYHNIILYIIVIYHLISNHIISSSDIVCINSTNVNQIFSPHALDMFWDALRRIGGPMPQNQARYGKIIFDRFHCRKYSIYGMVWIGWPLVAPTYSKEWRAWGSGKLWENNEKRVWIQSDGIGWALVAPTYSKEWKAWESGKIWENNGKLWKPHLQSHPACIFSHTFGTFANEFFIVFHAATVHCTPKFQQLRPPHTHWKDICSEFSQFYPEDFSTAPM